MTRTGDWMQTYSGIDFYPQDPRPDEVYIRDIAHSLALMCRFAGHCRCFYSVAEHSLRVSKLSKGFELWGLLHDASEAYLVDLPRPVKRNSPISVPYEIMETRIMETITEHYGLQKCMPGIVKQADEILLATEARDLMNVKFGEWCLFENPLPEVIQPAPPGQIEFKFLEEFYRLSNSAQSQR
jgi:hypothetical protein